MRPSERSTLHARAGPRTSLLWGPGLPRAPGPSKCARPHSDQGVRDRPTLLLSPGYCRTAAAMSAGPRTKSKATATRAAFPQCTSYSVRPLYPRFGGKQRLPRLYTRVRRPLLVTIKGGGGLPLSSLGSNWTLGCWLVSLSLSGFYLPRELSALLSTHLNRLHS